MSGVPSNCVLVHALQEIEPRQTLPHIHLWSSFVYQGMEIKKDGENHTGRNCSLALRNERLTGRPLGRFEHEVDRADALVQEAIGRLSRHYPEHATCGAALEDLQKLRPHFQRALAALTEIERCRGLTQKELSRRRAFKILVEGG